MECSLDDQDRPSFKLSEPVVVVYNDENMENMVGKVLSHIVSSFNDYFTIINFWWVLLRSIFFNLFLTLHVLCITDDHFSKVTNEDKALALYWKTSYYKVAKGENLIFTASFMYEL
jgi:hypothetical protein